MDYKSKIYKLLALARSPVEAEAKAALLKAHELMAAHKISEADIGIIDRQDVVEKDLGLSFSYGRNLWFSDIVKVIADHWLCVSMVSHRYRSRSYSLSLIGLECDVDVCERTIMYAVDYVGSFLSSFKKQHAGDIDAGSWNLLANSYGRGFALGVDAMYKRQEEEHQEWALVLKVPSSVVEKTKGMGSMKFKKQVFSDSFLERGYRDGLKFDPSTKLEEANRG